MSCHLKDKKNQVTNGDLAQFDANRQLWQLLFAPQSVGDHKLNIFAKRTNESKSTYVAQLDLYVTKLIDPMKFPTIYSKFHEMKCQIYEPLNGTLKQKSSVTIHCRIPGVADVQIATDDNFTKTEGYNDPVLKTQVMTGKKSLTIYTKKTNDSSYDGLFTYSLSE